MLLSLESGGIVSLSPGHFPCSLLHGSGTWEWNVTTWSGTLSACQTKLTLIQMDIKTRLQRKHHWVSAGKGGPQKRNSWSSVVCEVCGHRCVGKDVNTVSQWPRTGGSAHTRRQDRGSGPSVLYKWMKERWTEALKLEDTGGRKKKRNKQSPRSRW